ncbi:BPSS1780 family membrane protein [Accumulibacter sp.]|uniref:BPSS1780 family membrane protein n=1 Tax=Accumulibacter sp. TaxID=2053492 RepID=UPI0028C48B6F|nr:BPSS1780 family membrane protein [Accumulibacter sp.]
MQALTLPAAHGWRWLADGFRLFRKNHLLLTFLVVSYWMLMALVNVVPVLGTIATTLCIPAFSVSLMNACRNIERGVALGPQLLFSGFEKNLRALLTLGAIYLAATVGILALSALADGGALMQLMLAGHKPDEESMTSGDLLLATQIALVLLCPLVMAYWYAPILAAWHGLSPGKALFFSFIACVRNWRAFLVYSLATMVAATLLPALILGVLVALLPDGIALLTVLVTMAIVLILAPTLFASFYVSYRDVFVTNEGDA